MVWLRVEQKKTGLGVCRQCLSRSAVKWVTRLSSVLSLPQDQQSEARKAALQELDTQFSVQVQSELCFHHLLACDDLVV